MMESVFITLLAGLLTGILSGLLGIGGGVILVPIMIFILGMSQHDAQGVSLLVIIPTAMTAIWQLHKAKLVNYNIAMYLALGAIVGSLISSNCVQYISSNILKRIFGIFIVCMGVRMIIKNANGKSNKNPT